jgi:uncharacterized membrane protein
MKSMAFPLIALALAYLIFFGYVATSYGELPQRIASHFDFNGHANGWMSRGACTGIMVATAIFVPGLIIGLMGAAGKIPVSFINLPHKDYWLAAERRDFALAVLLRFAIWFAAATVLFLAGVQWMVVRANHSPVTAMDMPVFAKIVTAYLVTTGLWTFLLVRRFLKMPQES